MTYSRILVAFWVIAVVGVAHGSMVDSPDAIVGQGATSNCIISLQPDQASPQLVGERIIWTAAAINCGENPIFQFSVAGGACAGKDDALEYPKHRRFNVVRDFSPDNTFAWAPMQEGTYDIRVTIKQGFEATNTTSATVSDAVTSRVTGSDAVVTPTVNPLVALYSAPPCSKGSMLVHFRAAGASPELPWMSTDPQPCVPGHSRNFLVAGMLADTTYQMVHVITDGSASSSPLLFTTETPPSTLDFPRFTVRQEPGPNSDLSQNMLFHILSQGGGITSDVNILATDLIGRVEWYYDPLISGLVGTGAASLWSPGTVLFQGSDRYGSVVREVDLAGNPLRETNAGAINAQLIARGQDVILGFHHDTERLPNGGTAVIAYVPKTVEVNGVPKDYMGDMIIVLDEDFQVAWTWNAFDYLDVNRAPVLGEIFPSGRVDWLHSNAVSWSPSDGNLVVSVRHQDWVIKIDYDHGSGDGHIIWRLGKDGDFANDSTDPHPWFSHQHNPHYLDNTTLVLFDNGNTRCVDIQDCHSRGQVLALDEESLEATPLLIDMGNSSDALGSAQRLPSGNFVFTSGSQGMPPAQFGQSIEMLPDGTKTYVLEIARREYRSFRMSGLYRGTNP